MKIVPELTELPVNIVDDAFEIQNYGLEANFNSFGQQENNEIYDEQCQQLEVVNAESCEEDYCEIEGEIHPNLVNESTSRQTLFLTDDVIIEH